MKTLILIPMFLISCQGAQDAANNAAARDSAKLQDQQAAQTDGEATQLIGYINNAFGVSVDGKDYTDSEDFYTQKITELTDSAKEAGYDGWGLALNAELGLDDLKNGMQVFVASGSQYGFAGSTQVDYDGSFRITIPENARSSLYSLRANKKIDVTLTPPEGAQDDNGNALKPVRWCYNFSATMHGIPVNGEPVNLKKFSSTLTKYACQVSSSGITIPKN